MIKLRYISIIVLLSLIVTGCFSPVKLQPQNIYTVSCVPDPIRSKNKNKTLMVLPPITFPAYNSSLMAYSKKTFGIAYYSKNRWVTTPGQMIHPLLVTTLQQSHHFHAVLMPPFVGHYDYVLGTEVLKVEQDFTCCPPEAIVAIRAQLTDANTNKVIATKNFITSASLEEPPPYGGVLATNCAVCKVLENIRAFVLKHTG